MNGSCLSWYRWSCDCVATSHPVTVSAFVEVTTNSIKKYTVKFQYLWDVISQKGPVHLRQNLMSVCVYTMADDDALFTVPECTIAIVMKG